MANKVTRANRTARRRLSDGLNRPEIDSNGLLIAGVIVSFFAGGCCFTPLSSQKERSDYPGPRMFLFSLIFFNRGNPISPDPRPPTMWDLMSSGRTGPAAPRNTCPRAGRGLRRMPPAVRVGPLRRRSALTLGVRPSPAGSGPSPDASEVAAGGMRRGDRIGLRHVRTGGDRIDRIVASPVSTCRPRQATKIN